jgi:hypothetical protein
MYVLIQVLFVIFQTIFDQSSHFGNVTSLEAIVFRVFCPYCFLFVFWLFSPLQTPWRHAQLSKYSRGKRNDYFTAGQNVIN